MAGRQGKAARRDGSFDAYDLVRRGATYAGKFDAAALPRLIDELAPEGGSAEVSWRIAGLTDPSGRPALEVRVEGSMPLVCQRCLQPFTWPVAQCTTLLLAHDDRPILVRHGEAYEGVFVAAAPLDAATLAEDELLLTLPFAPRCERVECTQSAIAGAGDVGARAPAPAFAALAAIKSGGAKKGRN